MSGSQLRPPGYRLHGIAASRIAYWGGALLLRRMFGWSLKLFRVSGIQLAVHASFFLLLGITALAGWQDSGMSGLLWQTAALMIFFACVVLHELGHCFAAMHYGIGVRRILLLPIGGMAEFDSIPREPRRELVITLAGPAVNFAIAAALWLALPRDLSGPDAPMTLLGFGHLVMQWNLLMGVFNLLPAFPMDGGRIVRALLATRINYVRATFWAASIGKALCVVGFVVAGFKEPMLMLLFAFIFFVGEMEYRAVKRREQDDAYYRETLARLYPPAAPLEEPPPLQTR